MFETALAEYSDRNNGEVRSGLFAGGRWIRTIGTPEREAYFFPRRNSLAGTASRRGRAVGSNGQGSVRTATSSNGAEREPPILRISLFAGAHARCRAGSAGGRSRPCSPNIPRCAPGLDRIGAVAPVAGLDLALRQVLDLAAQLPRPASARVRCAAGRPIAARPRSAKRAVEANP